MAAAPEGLLKRDPADFTALWPAANIAVRSFLNSYLGDRDKVDDCVQEVAVLAWKKGPLHDGQERFLAFSIACARRLAMAEVRKKYRTATRPFPLETLEALAERVAIQELDGQDCIQPRLSALRGCLGQLESEPRHLLELRYGSTDTSALKKEAREKGSSIDALYKRLERLRSLLRDCVTRKTSGQG